jgi:NAD(P)-dependent dehydrogenase (short-subunit alcohol dehydrogenase family)
LTGKTVLVTGATSGIGLETARALAGLGAHVIVGARDPVKGSAVVDELRANGGSAEALALDVASLASIRAAAARVSTEHPRIDVLVNNAGVIALKRVVNADGHELTWATNFIGLAALTRALQPALEAAPAARIVNVSSTAHRSGRIAWDDLELERGFTGWRAYAQSKLAVNLWTLAFAKRHPALTANAVHPGAIATNIWRVLPGIGRALVARLLPPASKGAATVVRLAISDDLAGVTGRYYDKLVEAPATPKSVTDPAADADRIWAYAEAAIA